MKKRSGMAYFLYNGTILFETCFFVYYIERNVAAESKQASYVPTCLTANDSKDLHCFYFCAIALCLI